MNWPARRVAREEAVDVAVHDCPVRLREVAELEPEERVQELVHADRDQQRRLATPKTPAPQRPQRRSASRRNSQRRRRPAATPTEHAPRTRSPTNAMMIGTSRRPLKKPSQSTSFVRWNRCQKTPSAAPSRCRRRPPGSGRRTPRPVPACLAADAGTASSRRAVLRELPQHVVVDEEPGDRRQRRRAVRLLRQADRDADAEQQRQPERPVEQRAARAAGPSHVRSQPSPSSPRRGPAGRAGPGGPRPAAPRSAAAGCGPSSAAPGTRRTTRFAVAARCAASALIDVPPIASGHQGTVRPARVDWCTCPRGAPERHHRGPDVP